MAWWKFWEQAPAPSFDPREPLPNPEARPAAFLTATWLTEAWSAEGTLEALRWSRTLLGDATCHMDVLKDLWRALGPSLGPAQLAAEAVRAPAALRALLARGAEVLQERPEQAEGLRLLLRALILAYRFHANLFGLRHRLEADQPVQGRPPVPSALPTIWAQTYRPPVQVFVGPQVPDAWLRPPQIQRLAPSEVLPALRTCLAQGIPACITGAQPGLGAALGAGTHCVLFDPLSGRSSPVELGTLTEISIAVGDRAFLDDLYAEPALL